MVVILLGLVAVAAAVALGAKFSFERRMAREINTMLADARPSNAQIITERDLERLPEPVRRWLRHSHVVGSPLPTTVRLRQNGQFQMAGRGWMPFAAEQYFTINPPGFLWKATFTWWRYGDAAAPTAEEQDPLFDRFMPTYEIAERHNIRIATPATVTLDAARHMHLQASPVVRTIIRAREVILSATPDDRQRPPGLLAEV